jgi:predicted Rdx family selenoprotein
MGQSGCDGSIFIERSQISGFPGHNGAMKIYVYDHLAAYQDMKAVDETIRAGHDAYLNTAPTETTTPDL